MDYEPLTANHKIFHFLHSLVKLVNSKLTAYEIYFFAYLETIVFCRLFSICK